MKLTKNATVKALNEATHVSLNVVVGSVIFHLGLCLWYGTLIEPNAFIYAACKFTLALSFIFWALSQSTSEFELSAETEEVKQSSI